MSGSYNQTKTNTSGCMDSAAVAYVIYDQATGCAMGIDEQSGSGVNVYPNPVQSNLTIESAELINNIVVFDVAGKEVFRAENLKKQSVNLDLNGLGKGSYFVKISTASGETIRKIQK
jgi:hypothetical protein